MKILRVKFKRNFKNFYNNVGENSEENQEKFEKFTQTGNLCKICEKNVYLTVLNNLWVEVILKNFKKNSKEAPCKYLGKFLNNFGKTI